ncbi:MAG: hypothetical protein QOI42_93 [Frankiaceae bacterium]|nr:hypothetical protein [Frankiaceae bacterium]
MYDADPLAAGRRRPSRSVPEVPAELGLVVEDAAGGWCGAVVAIGKAAVTLEDRHGKRRIFPLEPAAFLVEGAVATLVRPAAAPAAARRTASGSVAASGARASIARAGRIYVEGRHDAELVEQIWGDDLRVEGVVVEMLDGADNLADVVAEFGPGPDARLGVLLDHLVTGSKESRIATAVRSPHVLIVGHPYVDVWQAVKPGRVGLAAWPVVPRGLPWKETVAASLGEPDVPTAWRRIRAAARSWTDLEPELLGPVEQLIDFVTG